MNGHKNNKDIVKESDVGEAISDTVLNTKNNGSNKKFNRHELELLASRINKQLVVEKGESKKIEDQEGSLDETTADFGERESEERRLEEEAEKSDPSFVDIGLEITKERTQELFVDQFDNPFAAIKVAYDGRVHTEAIPVNNNKFKRWVLKLIYDGLGIVPNDKSLTTICDILNAEASFGNNIKSLDLRVSSGSADSIAAAESTIFYDLTNRNWQVVRITQEGWSIAESSNIPVMFRRYSNQLTQVSPQKDYPPEIFDHFMNLINVKVKDRQDREDLEEIQRIKLLLKCYIISLFIPEIPKPVLMLHGEQGTAKTTCQELIKKLVDPSSVLTLVFPRNIEELIQQLSHNYISYYDNKSIIREWISDQLCRGVTGSGFSKRKLYSDDDDMIYHFKRAIGFNGINLAASKADLLDRGIIIELSFIEEKDRRPIKEIWNEFDRIKPQLLGYIFEILARVLQVRNNGGIQLRTRSRMADFEEYAEIISRCMGYKDGDFIKAYRENKNIQTEAALDGTSVGRAIIDLMGAREMWKGTTTELLAELEIIAVKLKINTQKEKLWPRASHILSRRITQIKTNLRQVGILIDDVRDPKTRLKTIEIRVLASEASEASDVSELCSNGAKFSDVAADATADAAPRLTSGETPQNHVQSEGSDATNATNANIKTSINLDPRELREQQLELMSRQKTYPCHYCRIGNMDGSGNIISFDTLDQYLRHVVLKHPGWTAYPQVPDLAKFTSKLTEKRYSNV